MLTNKTPINAKKYVCENCDFKCSKQSDWNRHITTLKHTNHDKCLQKKHPPNTFKKYTCECGKEYGHRQSLHIHKKNCIKLYLVEPEAKTDAEIIEEKPDANTDTEIIEEEENEPHHTTVEPEKNIFLKKYDSNPNELSILTNLVLEVVKSNGELLKQNGEFQKQTNELQKQNLELNKQVLDVYQKIQPTTINNNSHNKTFNLNFFLNEQCKDAMNIMDFVNTFHLQFSDLERIGEVGYVEGISNLIINKLNEMDIYKRPIHCSDAKREIMHIKDNDVWEKDNENNDKLRLAIKHITKKNIDMIGSWTEKYPGVRYSDHRLNDKFNEIIMEAMGGKNNSTMKEGESKIIKKICKMVLIDKNM